jgi:ATP-binding cassette subfamily B protein
MERGATLSLGQRQLLSFIRALLYNPAILILDEATSSIDTESEALIQHAIEKLIAGRTSIVIAHRLSTIRKADKILVLDKGEVKEIGTHNELLQNKGFYYQLYQMQFSGDQISKPVL